MEIGVGRHKDIETVIARWADTQPLFGVSAHPKQVVDLIEPKNPTGSCPYLYAWDGTRFRFLTDILSSAPVGLPSRPGHNIVADPREWVALGGTTEFVPKDGRYTVQLTEELREILYLDEAKLGWVDIESNAEAHSTSKLVPRQPFPGTNCGFSPAASLSAPPKQAMAPTSPPHWIGKTANDSRHACAPSTAWTGRKHLGAAGFRSLGRLTGVDLGPERLAAIWRRHGQHRGQS